MLIEVLGESSPFILAVVTCAIYYEFCERREFNKYVNARRRYSEWRLDHLDEL